MTRTLWTWGLVLLLLPRAAAGQGGTTCAGLEHAILLFNAGDRDRAYPELYGLAEKGCPEPIVYLYMGVVERARRELTRAAATMRRGLALAPANTQLWLELAVTYSWSDHLPEALAAYRAAIRLDPASTPARLGEARVLAWLGERDDAVSRFEAVLGTEPTNLEALNGLASVHVLALRPDAARSYYSRALAVEPTNTEARDGLRKANALRRAEIAVGLSNAAGARSPVGLMASYRLTPELRVSGGYDTSARDPLREPLGGRTVDAESAGAPFGWRAGAEWRATRQSVIAINTQSRQIAGDTATSFGVDVSRTLTRRLVALGGLQPGRSTLGGAWTLGSAGLSIATSRDTTVVLQGFRSASRGGGSTAMAATVVARMWGRGSVRASMARGGERGAACTTLSGQAVWLLSPGTEVRVDGTWYGGPVRTRHIAATLTGRF